MRGHPAAEGWSNGEVQLEATNVAFVGGAGSRVASEFTQELRAELVRLGHIMQPQPDDETDMVVTSALFGEPLSWRDAPLFTLGARYGVRHNPVVYCIVHATSDHFASMLDQLTNALQRAEPNPGDYRFDGLSDTAYRVLHEQGMRGGPILALERLVQAQVKSIRVLLLVGDGWPDRVYHFDLVGAHPQSTGPAGQMLRDVVCRMVTTARTRSVAEHQPNGELIPRETWERLAGPASFTAASAQLQARDFFTDPVVIAELVDLPVISRVIAAQYSEGCMATWDPHLGQLVTTVTGSARPVHKGQVTKNDLAVIAGVRSDGSGATYVPIEGLPNNVPSSEGIELAGIDQPLPWVRVTGARLNGGTAPVARSKLHGHRGVGGYDPERVEFVPLDPPFYDYLVSCASDAQATGVREAFGRSQALRDSDDRRQVVFTVLPGHGVMIVEKWVEGREPFEEIWRAMDDGALDVVSRVPQGRLWFVPDGGRMALAEPEA